MNIRNPRLVARLARAARKPAPLQLIGYGLDAIILTTRRYGENWLERLLHPTGWKSQSVPFQPTAEQRLARYHDALYWNCPPDHSARALRGEVLQMRLKQPRPTDAPVVFLDNYRGLYPRTRGH